jgi:hypothetical protein
MASFAAEESGQAPPNIRRALRRLVCDSGGASAVMVAFALPALIGFAGLGAETGLWYGMKGRNQSAADAAALSAADEVINAGSSGADALVAAANQAISQNGYTGDPPAIVYPYSDQTVPNGLSVTLRQRQGALLASLMLPSVTISTSAVAIVKVYTHPCILALSPAGTGVEIPDSLLDLSGCSAAANSTGAAAINIGDQGVIEGVTLSTAGQITLSSIPVNPYALPGEFVLSLPPEVGAAPVSDPYATLLSHEVLVSGMPTVPAAANSWNAAGSIGPGLYQGGMSFLPNAAIDLSPGAYYVVGGDFSVAAAATLTCSGCRGGAGVTIILTSTASNGPAGNVQIASGAGVTLSAPAAGLFSGVLFIRDPVAVGSANASSSDSAFEGGPRMNLTGLLYLPRASVSFAGNPSASCTVLVADELRIDGKSTFATFGCAGAGLAALPAVNTSALAE